MAEMRENPAGIRFSEVCKVATHYFGSPRQDGTSHKVWKVPWAGDPRVNMQEGDGGKAKTYQVRQATAAIDKLLSQQTGGSKKIPTGTVAATKQKKRR